MKTHIWKKISTTDEGIVGVVYDFVCTVCKMNVFSFGQQMDKKYSYDPKSRKLLTCNEFIIKNIIE